MIDINKLIMRLTGQDHWGDGQYGPPEANTFRYRVGNNKVIPRKDEDSDYQVFASNNDGFELWMGWNNSWYYHLNQSEVWALFKWIAIEWYLKARWLGLRRPLYYWALHRHVEGFKKGTRD